MFVSVPCPLPTDKKGRGGSGEEWGGMRKRGGGRVTVAVSTAVSEIIIARYEKCSAALANVYITERPNLRHF